MLGKLRAGTLDKQDYYRQLLRLVYRLLFLFVAEDRELLSAPEAGEKARQRYTRFYSVSRLRRLAERRLGTRHSDLYHGLRLVMQKLGNGGCAELSLPALGSFLFSNEAIADLNGCEIANSDLLEAIRALAFITDGHGRRTVDYRNLRSEELGSVYEALLELHPVINAEAREFHLDSASGNERKTTGSYYTPDSLVQCLLDSALDPVIRETIARAKAGSGEWGKGRRHSPLPTRYQSRLDPPPALGWTPPEMPEMKEDRETEGRGDGEKEGGTTSPDFQLRQEDARPQPGLFDEVK